MSYRKKLIEVSLPLEAINKEAAREKSIRHGHPSTLHLWWARRPLAACRAVLFSSLVDDPSEYMPDENSARIERERLFGIIEELVVWENSNNEEILDKAKLEIARSVARNLHVDMPVGKEAVREFLATKAPPILDPFAGGGSIPLEAQRLGLRSYARDINPVAVLINKALIEIPPKFANLPPIHPPEDTPSNKKKGKKGESTLPLFAREWKGAQGLAEDIRYYGKWMRNEAYKHIGHLYPPVSVTQEMMADRPDLKEQGIKPGDRLTVIAWIWARTVKCPNPACGVEMPLTRSFILSSKKNRPAWIEPMVLQEKGRRHIKFTVRIGKTESKGGTVNKNGATCICCDTPVSFEYIRLEGQQHRIGTQMMAIVAEGKKGRIYFSPEQDHESIADQAQAEGFPETSLPEKALGFRVQLYGLTHHFELFTRRQLLAMMTLSDITKDASELISSHVPNNYFDNPDDYSNAIAVYLGIAVSRQANRLSTICFWDTGGEKIQQVFARQALPMTWDFVEGNPFSDSSGNFFGQVEYLASVIDYSPTDVIQGSAIQDDASHPTINGSAGLVVSTDPPYYDNINYADLSDFFYIWLRLNLSKIYPELFTTLLTPKSSELIAEPGRFNGNKQNAIDHFEKGLSSAFSSIATFTNPNYPISIYYAFKQQETDNTTEDDLSSSNTNTVASTGWEKMLEALIRSGFSIAGTWPMRTEQGSGLRLVGRNSLASSIVLVCRPRLQNSLTISRREFLAALRKELAPGLHELQQGSIAPVDLAQAAIGPGMAVFSNYNAVLEADGTPMSVRTALTLINQALDEYLSEQEGEYDGDTRWALSWYEQFGHNEAAYGVAETLSKAKNTAVEGLAEAGILEARGGKVRLLRRDELEIDWDPIQDKRLTAWEAVQHLIYALENEGEESAAGLLAKLGVIAEPARDLAYRLYTVCERKGWAQDALGYNMLVVAWPRLKELAAQQKSKQEHLL